MKAKRVKPSFLTVAITHLHFEWPKCLLINLVMCWSAAAAAHMCCTTDDRADALTVRVPHRIRRKLPRILTKRAAAARRYTARLLALCARCNHHSTLRERIAENRTELAAPQNVGAKYRSSVYRKISARLRALAPHKFSDRNIVRTLYIEYTDSVFRLAGMFRGCVNCKLNACTFTLHVNIYTIYYVDMIHRYAKHLTFACGGRASKSAALSLPHNNQPHHTHMRAHCANVCVCVRGE